MPTTQDVPPNVIQKEGINPPLTKQHDEERKESLGVEHHTDQDLGNELDNQVNHNIGQQSDEPGRV